MTAYFPNFNELFLTRYCRDKLVCAPKCRRVIIASDDVPVVYPNIQKLLGPFYRNMKITQFNDVYQQLSHYLKAYPKELEQMNAILWRWIRENSRRHCRVKKPHHKNSNWLASRKHGCKGRSPCGPCGKSSCGKCDETCTNLTSWDQTSDLVSEWKSGSTTSCSKSKSCSTKTKSSCNKSSSNCHTKSSDWKTDFVSSKDCTNATKCGADSHCSTGSESSSDNESYSQSTSEHHSTDSKPSTENDNCCESKYEGDECCPGDNFVCEPKNHRVKWAVPHAKELCHPLPCTGTLQFDLACVVPQCLKDDEQLSCLLADVARHLL